MTTTKKIVLAACAVAIASGAKSDGDSPAPQPAKAAMLPTIKQYVAARQAEFDSIDEARKEKLEEISRLIRSQSAAKKPIRLIFVCTHNSRRSHMGQLWAAVAAETYGIRISGYSGGTESTAFNARAVSAMERAGFQIEKTTDDENPIYHARFSTQRPAVTCFSKRFDNPPNPRQGFAAIMVCAEADKHCPAVSGTLARFAIPYADPKVADGKDDEAAKYDERCAQIAREMLYVFSRV